MAEDEESESLGDGLERLGKSLKESKKPGCPVYPASVEEIMSTVDRLDKGEIDDFTAMQEVTQTLKAHRQKKQEALKKAELLLHPSHEKTVTE